jgi:ubiquinone/menaquinone biosynthesis C-methylase UbiE
MLNALHRLFLPLNRLAHWPDGVAYQHAQRRWMVNRLLDKVSLDDVRVVVEVGCGDGWICSELARRLDATVVGFDFNPNRIGQTNDPRVMLVAGDAAHPVVADGAADLIVTFAVLEHLPNRQDILRELSRMLSPGGKMIHVVPMSTMKVFQWLGHLPDLARKQVRGLTRFMAGQRRRKTAKYYPGRDTNNPQRLSRPKWYRHALPRIHGEYNSNLNEMIENSNRCWVRLFEAAGLGVLRRVPLGLCSPYFFGLSARIRAGSILGLTCVNGYIVERSQHT